MRLCTTIAAALSLASSSLAGTQNDFWRNFDAKGINLGNWLILEEWMSPALFSQYSVTGATDEWTFCQQLGSDQCTRALQSHWQSFVQETDVLHMRDMGLNLIRIPLGFWALIDPTADEPYVRSTQMDNVERILGYASKAGIYVVLDLHGLPGSQNGWDHSGHQGPIGWYTSTNMQRSLNAVSALSSFVKNSANGGVVAAIEIANEPNINTTSTKNQYQTYISAAQKIISADNATMPIMFHDGFAGPAGWTSFVKDKSLNYVLDVHRFYFGGSNNAEKAQTDVCSFPATVNAANIAAPVFVGEWSISVSGVFLDTTTWRRQFLETQWAAWIHGGAGGAFWSYKVENPDGSENNGWSYSGIYAQGIANADTFKLQNNQCTASSYAPSTATAGSNSNNAVNTKAGSNTAKTTATGTNVAAVTFAGTAAGTGVKQTSDGHRLPIVGGSILAGAFLSALLIL